MLRIPAAWYICWSGITLEEGMANQVTVACFHYARYYKCLNWMIWKLGLSQPVSCIGCTMHHERICACHLEIYLVGYEEITAAGNPPSGEV